MTIIEGHKSRVGPSFEVSNSVIIFVFGITNTFSRTRTSLNEIDNFFSKVIHTHLFIEIRASSSGKSILLHWCFHDCELWLKNKKLNYWWGGKKNCWQDGVFGFDKATNTTLGGCLFKFTFPLTLFYVTSILLSWFIGWFYCHPSYSDKISDVPWHLRVDVEVQDPIQKGIWKFSVVVL